MIFIVKNIMNARIFMKRIGRSGILFTWLLP